jgi:hypothetical protein
MWLRKTPSGRADTGPATADDPGPAEPEALGDAAGGDDVVDGTGGDVLPAVPTADLPPQPDRASTIRIDAPKVPRAFLMTGS